MRKTFNLVGWHRGKRIRDGEGHPGAATPVPGADNQPAGNTDAGASGAGESNNDGQGFNPASFWDGPAPSGAAAPSGESAGNAGGESGANQNEFAQQLMTRLSGLNLGQGLFDEAAASQISEGNFDSVNQRFSEMGQQIIRESLAMQVQILKPLAEQILEQVRSETSKTFDQRDNVESLERLFPAAKNPVMAKTIGPIYDQALKNAGGNRDKAVAQTKEMLRFMAGESASDLGIAVVSKGEEGYSRPTPSLNWLDELTGRK